MSVLPMFFVLFGLIAIELPVAFALIAASLAYLQFGSPVPMSLVVQRMSSGIDSFPLLAIPLFVLAGNLLNVGGIAARIFDFAVALVGHLRGGLAQVNIFASLIFSGMSGVAQADAAGLGTVEIKAMKREGFDAAFAAACTAASAVVGPIIPPSVIMIIYAAVSRLSVIDLFLSGVVPGLMLALAVSVVVFIKGRKGGLPTSTITVARREVPVMARDTVLVLSLPMLIVAGTVSGTFTATEAGGVAALYAALLGFLVFRSLSLREAWSALVVSARTTSSLFLIIAAATVCSYVLALSGINQATAGLAATFAGDPVLFMLAVMAALLVVGCFLEPGAAIVLFVPMLMPVAMKLGIDPLQFAIVVVLTLTFGLMTPPVGVCLFVACKIGNISMTGLVRALAPFFLAEVAVVVLVILFPGFASWLPGLFR